MANLNFSIYKNKLHYIIGNTRWNNNRILNSCFYINTNNIWEYLVINLVSIIINYKTRVKFYNKFDLFSFYLFK